MEIFDDAYEFYAEGDMAGEPKSEGLAHIYDELSYTYMNDPSSGDKARDDQFSKNLILSNFDDLISEEKSRASRVD